MASAQPLGAPSQQRPLQPSPLSQATSANTQQQQQRYAVAATAQQQQQQQQTGPHLLSLKVMRASAPALASNEKPYYDDLDFSSANIVAVGRKRNPRRAGARFASQPPTRFLHLFLFLFLVSGGQLPVSNLLILPNSFGTLYLGETFRTYLCVRNESSTAVREPSLRVEMQVGSSDPQTSASSSSAGAQAGGDGVRWHQLAHLILPSPTRYSPTLCRLLLQQRGRKGMVGQFGSSIQGKHSKPPLGTI